MDQSTTPELPEYLKEHMDTSEDIFNVLCLVYNERSHNAFRSAVELLMEKKFECTVLDQSDYNQLCADANDANSYWSELEKYKGEVDSLRDLLRDLADDVER